MFRPGETLPIDVFADLTRRQISVRGVYLGSSNIKTDIPALAEAYLAGEINIDDLISREIDLEDINDAYAELATGAVARSVITSFDGKTRHDHAHR